MNDWEIPELDLSLCADRLALPVRKWGSRPRREPMPGTYHFYCDDYRFAGQRCRPEMVPATGCRVAVEANYSTEDAMPAYELLWWIAQKRRLARVWQDAGVRIVVDLNVCARAREFNLIGVPAGWTAYATRSHRGVPFAAIYEDFLVACNHAGTEEVLFAVFGGGREVRRICGHNGWAWIPEHVHAVHGLERPYG